MSTVRHYLLQNLQGRSFIIQQKAFILLWISIIIASLLVAANVINILSPITKNHLMLILSNSILMISFILNLFLLRIGKYELAVSSCSIVMTFRAVSGSLIKIDTIIHSGVNDNVYYMIAIIVFISLLGSRKLLIVVTSFFILFTAGLSYYIKINFPSPQYIYNFGSSVNAIFGMIIIFTLSFLVSHITERALTETETELEKNKKLSATLEYKVTELNVANEEMEAINEELIATNEELTSTNNELMEVGNSLENFKNFAEASGQGLAMADIDGNLIYSNRAFSRLTGFENPSSQSGKSLFTIYPDEIKIYMKENVYPLVIEKGQWTGELPLKSGNDGAIPTIQNIFHMQNDSFSKRYLAMVITDVSELKNLEQRLLIAYKMEALGKLTGGIAHDFNNILTVILGFGELLRIELDESDHRTAYVAEIIRAASLSSDITRQLLAFSKNQVLKPTVNNIDSIIGSMEKMIRRFTGEDVDLAIELGSSGDNIFADRSQIEQVIINLIINACDAMPEGGTIKIKTGSLTAGQEHTPENPDACPGKYCCLSISDTGSGIDSESLQHIFEPFYSTKEAGKGTGLGLAVVYGIIKQHSGWIDVSSTPGAGTVFNIYIPVNDRPAEDNTEKTGALVNLRGNRETILLVEDQESVRSFAAKVLRRNNYEVHEASNADDALKLFLNNPEGIDLLFTDVVLPGNSGIHLVEKIQDHKPGVKVLLSSGYTGKKSQLISIQEKGYPFLQKPYSLSDLLNSIYCILNV